MTKKYQICHHQIRFFKLKMHQNPFSAAPDPAGGAYDAPPNPLVGWGWGYPLPIFLPTRLEFVAYGASVLRPSSTQNHGYARAGPDVEESEYEAACVVSRATGDHVVATEYW